MHLFKLLKGTKFWNQHLKENLDSVKRILNLFLKNLGGILIKLFAL